jgi:short subunit dehydrogenase-like uncharacterized protein
MSTTQKYDLILFGVTGFTGKLAAEYLLQKQYGNWATCARNKSKAESILSEITSNLKDKETPVVLEADLICDTDDKKEELRIIVQQTKVVLTCAGPFEKYGTTLLQLCAEEGVDYCDITGETDFVRNMIFEHDATARKNGACIISHCGADCIPQDLLVFEIHRVAKEKGLELESVETFVDLPESAAFSGGSVSTLSYQLGKDRTAARSTDFDPLLMKPDGTKSEYTTKNISPKSATFHLDLNQKVGPWVMAPVMVNCVRRSNALLHYSANLSYGDSKIQNSSSWASFKSAAATAKIAAAIKIPLLKGLLPQPGQGPDRDLMEAGYLNLLGLGTAGDQKIKAKFHFGKDVAYLYTAAMLVETGMALLFAKDKTAGVVTPAVGLGHALTERLMETLDITLDIAIQ